MAGISFTFLLDIQVIKSTLSHLFGRPRRTVTFTEKPQGVPIGLKMFDAYWPWSLPSSRPNPDTPYLALLPGVNLVLVLT